MKAVVSITACALLIGAVVVAVLTRDTRLAVGSKSFTESAVLGHMLVALAEDTPVDAEENPVRARLRTFPGSAVAFAALKSGDIVAYPEYTGTLRRVLLADLNLTTDDELREALADLGLAMSEPIGFNNTYAIGVMPATAEEHGLRTIGDLARA
ncbi:MAG: glycine betaine ABC transporter substrate-binding protein, partial [Planctomycetota bacterium]